MKPKAINELAPNGLVMLDMQDYRDMVADVQRLEWLIENVNWEHCVKPKRDHKDWRLDIDEAMRGE